MSMLFSGIVELSGNFLCFVCPWNACQNKIAKFPGVLTIGLLKEDVPLNVGIVFSRLRTYGEV